jgi:hypothetical protein
MLDINALEDTVLKHTGLTYRLLHVVAEFFVPVLLKVLPSAKSSLAGLSLVLSSNLPPCLQATGEQLLDNVDGDVVFVVGDTPSMSDMTSLGLAIGIHDLNMHAILCHHTVISHRIDPTEEFIINLNQNKKKSGWQKESGSVGQPTNPVLLQND